MFDVADDALGLQAFHELAIEGARQNRIFPVVFKIAAVAWIASDIHASAKRHVVTLIAQLAPDERAVIIGSLQVPRGRVGETGRQGRRIAAGFRAEATPTAESAI